MNGKYPVQPAIKIVMIEDLGLDTHNSKRSKLFVESQYDDLSDDAHLLSSKLVTFIST